MNMSAVIIYIAIFGTLLYFLFSWLNRGKKQLKNLALTIVYSIVLGCTVFMTTISKEKPDPVLYFAVIGVLTVYPSYLMILDVIKRRSNATAPSLFFTGLLLAVLTPYLPEKINVFAGFGSMLVFAGFFIYLRAYPHLNFMWLEDAVTRSADAVPKACKYSSKPVVIHGHFNKRCVSRLSGFLLLIKKDRAIISMDKKLHTKLGAPNLMEFGKQLVKIITDKTGVEEKK